MSPFPVCGDIYIQHDWDKSKPRWRCKSCGKTRDAKKWQQYTEDGRRRDWSTP